MAARWSHCTGEKSGARCAIVGWETGRHIWVREIGRRGRASTEDEDGTAVASPEEKDGMAAGGEIERGSCRRRMEERGLGVYFSEQRRNIFLHKRWHSP